MLAYGEYHGQPELFIRQKHSAPVTGIPAKRELTYRYCISYRIPEFSMAFLYNGNNKKKKHNKKATALSIYGKTIKFDVLFSDNTGILDIL